MAIDTVTATLLKAQLRVQRAVQQRKAATMPRPPKREFAVTGPIHEVQRQIVERAFYPAHDARTESSEYAKVHKNLCLTLDLPCMVCGVKHSTLNDPTQNAYRARAMETHHHIIEWALANAVDVDHFNGAILPHLARRHPNDPIWHYEQRFDQQRVRDWVDHSEHNLWVLCDVHHRHKYLGIHAITYPIWCPQDLLRDDFQEYVRKQLTGRDERSAKTRSNSVVAKKKTKKAVAKKTKPKKKH